MKKMMMTLMAVLMMGTLCNPIYAQNNERKEPRKERSMQMRERGEQPKGEQKKERLNPEQLTEQRANRMARELALDDATTKRFVETYCRFHQERRALQPERGAKKEGVKKEEAGKKGRQALANPSEAECKQLLESRMEREQKQLDLRKKYYNEYSKFLSQKQISRIYQKEKRQKQPMQVRGQRSKGCRPGKA